MLRAEPTLKRDGTPCFFGKFCTGKFWLTVRNGGGDAVHFATEEDAIFAAREAWSVHFFNPGGWNKHTDRPSKRKGEKRKYVKKSYRWKKLG